MTFGLFFFFIPLAIHVLPSNSNKFNIFSLSHNILDFFFYIESSFSFFFGV